MVDAMCKFDLVIYESGDLAAALTSPGTPAIFIDEMSEEDALALVKTLHRYGVNCCISPHKED